MPDDRVKNIKTVFSVGSADRLLFKAEKHLEATVTVHAPEAEQNLAQGVVYHSHIVCAHWQARDGYIGVFEHTLRRVIIDKRSDLGIFYS